MGGVSSETCWAIKKHWNNKFYYTVASCWFFLWGYILFRLDLSLVSLQDWCLLQMHCQCSYSGLPCRWSTCCLTSTHATIGVRVGTHQHPSYLLVIVKSKTYFSLRKKLSRNVTPAVPQISPYLWTPNKHKNQFTRRCWYLWTALIYRTAEWRQTLCTWQEVRNDAFRHFVKAGNFTVLLS
jgi:hypothetical protein